jgi:hypothetical protein
MSDLDQLKQYIVELKADRDLLKAKEAQEAWTKVAGVSVVLVAVLAAVATQWATKYSSRTLTALNDATYSQTLASDQWNFYQAKSIKENLYEVAREQEEASPSARAADAPAKLGAKISKFAAEKLTIKAAAEKYDRDRQQARQAATRWAQKGGAMGLAVAVFQIAIAVASIAMLMKRKPFWYAALVLAAGATAQMLYAWLT